MVFLVAYPGLEPGTPWLKVKCSTDWASRPYKLSQKIFLAGVAGFEPTNARIKILCLTTWRHPYVLSLIYGWGGRIRTYAMLESESNALPLGDTPPSQSDQKLNLGWSKGIEPLTSRATIWRSANWTTTTIKLCGAPRRIRTFDLCLRRALLYPAELWKHSGAGEGNRTLATSLEGWGSTTELHLHITLLTLKVYHIVVDLSRNLTKNT